MIAREGPVKMLDLVWWARAQARKLHRDPDSGEMVTLSVLQAQVLLNSAIYANREGRAWPSIATLAEDAGLKVKVIELRDGREKRDNSAVGAAIAKLQSLGLIWRTEGGDGRPATTELLMPDHWPGSAADPRAAAGHREAGDPELGHRHGGDQAEQVTGMAVTGHRHGGAEEPKKSQIEEPEVGHRFAGDQRPSRRSGNGRSPRKLSAARYVVEHEEFGDEEVG